MPYRRRYARRRTSTRRRPARRYTRRPTRVTRYRRRPTMSRRRILNITTKKKQDTMVPVVPADLIATSVVAQAVTIPGTAPQVMVWVATARDRASPSEDQESESRRTSQTVYMRGLKERVNILTNNVQLHGRAALLQQSCHLPWTRYFLWSRRTFPGHCAYLYTRKEDRTAVSR